MEVTEADYLKSSEDSQGYAILQMVLAAVKRTVPATHLLAQLPEADETAMIKLGNKVVKGKATSKAYSNKMINIIQRIIKAQILDKDYLARKIEGYVQRDIPIAHEKLNKHVNLLEKLTNKKVILEVKTSV